MRLMKGFYAILLLTIQLPLWSFQFQPISLNLESRGTGASGSFLTYNDGQERIALRIAIYRRSTTVQGEEQLTEVDSDTFQLYPPRIILEPEQSQTIRVVYRGDNPGRYERAYRIIVEQVPVDFDQDSRDGGLRILFRYIGSIYILPDNETMSMEISQIQEATVEGFPYLKLMLHNNGSVHTIIQDIDLALIWDGGEYRLSSQELEPWTGINLLAGELRELYIRRPPAMTDQIPMPDLVYQGVR